MTAPNLRWLPGPGDRRLHDVLPSATRFAAAACHGDRHARAVAACGVLCDEAPDAADTAVFLPCESCRAARPDATDGAWSAYVTLDARPMLSKRDLIRRYVHEQHPQARIAAEVGVSRAIVRRWLTETGVARRPGGNPGYGAEQRAAITKQLVEAYKHGNTIEQAARAAHVGATTARELLLAAGVRLHPRGKRANRHADPRE